MAESGVIVIGVFIAIVVALAITFALKNKFSKKCEDDDETFDLDSDIRVKELFEKNEAISYLVTEKKEIYIVKEESDVIKNSLKVTNDDGTNWTINLPGYSGVYVVKTWDSIDSNMLLATGNPTTLQNKKCKSFTAPSRCFPRNSKSDSYRYRENISVCKKESGSTCEGELKSVKIVYYTNIGCLGIGTNTTANFWVCTS